MKLLKNKLFVVIVAVAGVGIVANKIILPFFRSSSPPS